MRDEAVGNFPKIVNRYFDKTGIHAHPVRYNLAMQIRRRLNELFASSKIQKVDSDYHKIENMYAKFAKAPELKAKLIKLQVRKNRGSLFPSISDMKILAEADELGGKCLVNFITDDSDFLEFKTEIEKELRVKIVALLDLPHFFDKR